MAFGHLLRRLGVSYLVSPPGGSTPIAGIRQHTAPDLASAMLVAQAEGTMGAGLGAVLDGEILTLVSRPLPAGESAPVPIPVGSATAFVAALDEARRHGRGTLAVRLGFDPNTETDVETAGSTGPDADPADPALPRVGGQPDPSLAARLAAAAPGSAGPKSAGPKSAGQEPAGPQPGGSLVGGTARPLTVDFALVGRGIIRAGAVEALRGFTERTGLGVLNTFTAKGLFPWDSPFHLGTGCLQERDLALAGAHPTAVIATIGVDADECPDALLIAAGLDPGNLIGLDIQDLSDASTAIRARVPVGGERPRLYRELAAVAQPLYTLEAAPLNPARAAADIAAVLPAGAAVWAEPGTAGMWLARALPTTRLGSARVPADGTPGVAVAGALTAALRPGGVGVAVVEGSTRSDAVRSDAVQTLLDWAWTCPGTLVLEVWGDRGGARTAAEHREHLAAALARPGVHVIEVPVEYSATQALLDVSGPVVAWSGRMAAVGRGPTAPGPGAR